MEFAAIKYHESIRMVWESTWLQTPGRVLFSDLFRAINGYSQRQLLGYSCPQPLADLWAPGVLLLELIPFHVNVQMPIIWQYPHYSSPARAGRWYGKLNTSSLILSWVSASAVIAVRDKMTPSWDSPKFDSPLSSYNSMKCWISKRCYNIISWWNHPRHWQMAQRSQTLFAGNHGTANSVC